MTNKIGRLYYRYIIHSPLEAHGYTAKQLADELASLGLIKINSADETFFEVSKLPCKRDLIKLILKTQNFDKQYSGKITNINTAQKIATITMDNCQSIYCGLNEVNKGLNAGDTVIFNIVFQSGNLKVARNVKKG